MKKIYNHQPAFTLIEILVVISITIIFLGVGLAQYNTFTEQTKLKNEGKKLVDVLELAKKKASSSDLNGFTCSGGFHGYLVDIGVNSYSLNLRCLLLNEQISSYNFPVSNITIYSGIGLFRFKQKTAGLEYKVTEANDPTTAPLIQLKNSSINKCVSITINALGIVEFNETLQTCL